MKIKQTKKSLSSPSIKTITIGDLVKKIQRLLTKNLSLTARESSIECRFILEHGLKVDHQYLIKSYEQLIDPNKFKLSIHIYRKNK